MSNIRQFFIVIFIVIALLIAAILVLLYRLSEKNRHSPHQDATDIDDLRRYVENSIDAAFRKHEYEFTAVYAEERRLAEWLKCQLENDETDLASLAKETNERAIALAIKLAEDEVALEANTLTKVLNAISNKQGRLATSTEHQYPDNVVKREISALSTLQTQEVEVRARLSKAEANLSKIVKIAELSTAQPPRVLTPEDLGG